jgi:hypothetical protein
VDEPDAGAADQQRVAGAPGGGGASAPARPRVVDRRIGVAVEDARSDRRVRVRECGRDGAFGIRERDDLAGLGAGGVADRAVVDPA